MCCGGDGDAGGGGGVGGVDDVAEGDAGRCDATADVMAMMLGMAIVYRNAALMKMNNIESLLELLYLPPKGL